MKNKVLMLAAVFTFALAANSFAASSAFTWLTTTGGAATPTITSPNPTFSFKPSANVTFGLSVEATGVSYSLGTFHTSGTRTYATTSTDTNIYYFDNAAASLANSASTATKPADAPATATTMVSWGTGWSASK